MPYNAWLKLAWVEDGYRIKISRVVEIFLHATGIRVPPNIIRQCWPAQRDETPLQNLDGIRRDIIYKLDEVAMRYTSTIAWDPFAFPKRIRNIGEKKLCATVLGKRSTSEHACLASDLCFKMTKGSTPLWLRPHFQRIYVGLRPSTRHCTMGAHTRNICHPDNVRAVCSK